MKKVFLSGAALVAIVLSFGVTAYAQRVLGGYKKVSTDDTQVTAAADFAVEKKAEEQEGLTLISIEKAEIQSVAGTNFRLCLKVSLDEEEQEVQTVIHKNLKQIYSITSWTVKECGENASQSAANPALSSIAGYHLMPGVTTAYVEESEIDKPQKISLEAGKTAWFQVFYTDGMISANRRKQAPASAKVRVKAPQTDKEFVIKSAINAYQEVTVYFLRANLPD